MSEGYFHSLVAPLRVPMFRSLWIAALVSNLGTLMHGVGAAWLMTSMTTSPLLVGLVPACLFLPVFFAGLLGGALSDTTERRRVLIGAQSGMMACALAIGICTVLGRMSPGLLLGLTFCLGFFSAINLPAWQSQIQEMVPAGHVAAAVSLNSISFNAARSVGPAIGGLLVSAFGPASVFFLNAASFLGTIAVLLGWDGPPHHGSGKAVWESFKEGFLFVRHSQILRAPLVRASAFCFGASAVLAVLPLLAREELRTGPAGYGILLAAFGAGSVAVAGFVPGLRRRHHPDRMITPAIVVFAGVLVCLGLSRSYPLVLVALFAGGMAWVGVLVQFHVAVQISAPEKIRGRALSFYLVFFQGSMGIGSAFHGWLAKHLGIPQTLVIAGLFLLVGIPLAFWLPLGKARDHEASAIPVEGE